MADWWPNPLMGLGAPGILKYIPSERPGETLGKLEASRFTSTCPRFKIISSPTQIYPPSKIRLPEASTRIWRERQTQERWLSKAHPEIAMGNTAYQDALKEDMEELTVSNETPNTRPVLAIGHVPDLKDKAGIRKFPIMAVASGESGELLRLAHMEDTQWQWGENTDAFLNVVTIDPVNKEAEATWAVDGLSIRQVKFAGNRLQDETHRWLLVQKETATTILRPEYRQIPSASNQTADSFIRERPSLINPNPLFTIRHHQTGGSAHSDVAFLSTASGRSHQVAIIDEAGYWSIWDLPGAWQVQRKVAPQLSLGKCGHISNGLLSELPSKPPRPNENERHGVLIMEGVGPEKLEISPSPFSSKTTDATTRYLLMWNHERMEVLNLDANILLPRLGRIMRERGKLDWILDIQRSPTKQGHVFILTQYHITWVDVFSRDETGAGPLRPSIILSCPHLGTKNDDSRMFVCRASDDDEDTSLVFIYYPRMGQLCIYWFTFSPVSRMPQWHRDIISLPGSDDPEFPAKNLIEFLRVDPVQLAVSTKEYASSPGIDYHQKGVRFYQLSFLGKDLSLQRCLCVTSVDPKLEVQDPTSRVAWAEAKQQKRKEKRRRKVMAHITNSFLFPDEMTADDVEALLHGEETVEESGDYSHGGSAVARPVYIKMDRLHQALQNSLEESTSQGESGLPSQLFDALRQCLNDGLDQGRLPLLTWNDVVETLLRHPTYEAADDPMREEMEGLLDENDEKIVVTQLRRYNPDETPMSLVSLQYLQRYFSEIWLNPVKDFIPEDMHQIRRIWVTELARDAFLSNYGIMLQDIPLLGPASSEAAEEESQRVRPGPQIASSQITTPSRSRSRDLGSSPASSPAASSSATPGADGAIQRLQLLALSLDVDKLDVSKRSKVLAYWPTERGIDPNDYVSSVARANEELFRDAKEKLQRIEAKRKARLEKFRRPAFMRQGLPDINPMSPMRPPPRQVMSSQAAPDATQTHGQVVMSQPVSGLFGGRKKAKKGKRKSGF